MNTHTEVTQKTQTELEDCISRAMAKVKTQKETELCQFLPGEEGRLHHFAFGKLKKKNPKMLLEMIREHILEKATLETVSAKPRQRHIAKKSVEVKFKPTQINRLIELLKNSGDEELIAMLAPHQSLAQVQKSMIEMIRAQEIDQELWATYVKLVEEEKSARR